MRASFTGFNHRSGAGAGGGGGGYEYVEDPIEDWQESRILDLDADLVTNVSNGQPVLTIPDKVAGGATYNATFDTVASTSQAILVKNQVNQHAAIYIAGFGGFTIPQLPANAAAMTIAWIGKQPANSGFTQARRVISATDKNFLLSINGTLQMYSEGGEIVASGNAILANTFHLMIAEMDANGFRYYRAGTLLGSKSTPSAIGHIPRNLTIGISNYPSEVANVHLSRMIVFSEILTKGDGGTFNQFITAMATRYGILP